MIAERQRPAFCFWGEMAEGRTIRTPEKGDKLLAKLANGYSVTAACKCEGIGRTAYYAWIKDDPAFASAVDSAIESGTDLLEDEAKRRAVGLNGSDTLLIFLLKARRPDKYRERSTVDINLKIREKAEQMAESLGVPITELIQEAESIAAGSWDTWSPPQ